MRSEGKRAANRLREQWKKNPWVPGATIDLSEHEGEFQQQVGMKVRSPVPPGVLDWLRWKYRRLQIDQKRDREWLQVLHHDLPVRVSAAGPAPEAMAAEEENFAAVPTVWRVSDAEQFSKRERADQPKAPARIKMRSLRGPGRPRKKSKEGPDLDTQERNDFAMFVHQYREILIPLFAQTRDTEHMNIVYALRAFVADPNDRGTREQWFRIASLLTAR